LKASADRPSSNSIQLVHAIELGSDVMGVAWGAESAPHPPGPETLGCAPREVPGTRAFAASVQTTGMRVFVLGRLPHSSQIAPERTKSVAVCPTSFFDSSQDDLLQPTEAYRPLPHRNKEKKKKQNSKVFLPIAIWPSSEFHSMYLPRSELELAVRPAFLAKTQVRVHVNEIVGSCSPAAAEGQTSRSPGAPGPNPERTDEVTPTALTPIAPGHRDPEVPMVLHQDSSPARG